MWNIDINDILAIVSVLSFLVCTMYQEIILNILLGNNLVLTLNSGAGSQEARKHNGKIGTSTQRSLALVHFVFSMKTTW